MYSRGWPLLFGSVAAIIILSCLGIIDAFWGYFLHRDHLLLAGGVKKELVNSNLNMQ